MNNQEALRLRKKRVDDAIALKEPDRVPIAPFCATFPFHLAGYTCKETNYDLEKTKDAFRQYVTRYEPDMVTNANKNCSGQMPVFDLIGMKWLQWAGQEGVTIPDNTCFQCLDKEYLLEEEYPEFLNDPTGWTLHKYLPRAAKVFEPFANISFNSMFNYAIHPMTAQFAFSGLSEAFAKLEEAGKSAINCMVTMAEFDKELEEMGFIPQIAATSGGAFDALSCLRGTVSVLMDTMENPEYVSEALEKLFPSTLYGAIEVAKNSNGRLVMIPMMSCIDNFMSNETFEKFYWPTLLRLVNGLIDAGLTPWLYTEGRFNTRYEFLKQLPKGKCIVHFEDADMRMAKKELGDIACLSGGLNSAMLMHGTKEEVIEKTKENIDILAPGGGYIFDVGNCLDMCRPELVDAMFDTVKKFGVY